MALVVEAGMVDEGLVASNSFVMDELAALDSLWVSITLILISLMKIFGILHRLSSLCFCITVLIMVFRVGLASGLGED